MSELPLPFAVLIAVLAAVVILETALLLWLWRRQRQMAQRLQEWAAGQRRQRQDIAGLCAAGLQIDARLARLEQALSETREWLETRPAPEAGGAASYQTAIEMIRAGAGVEELVSECGFTREEANLLIRLHRDETGVDHS